MLSQVMLFKFNFIVVWCIELSSKVALKKKFKDCTITWQYQIKGCQLSEMKSLVLSRLQVFQMVSKKTVQLSWVKSLVLFLIKQKNQAKEDNSTRRPCATVRQKINRQKHRCICFFNSSTDRFDRDHANLITRHLQLTFCGAKAVRLCAQKIRQNIFIFLFNSSTDRLDRDRANLTQHHLQLTLCGAKTVRQCATARTKNCQAAI